VYAILFGFVGLLAASPRWIDGSLSFGRFLPLDFLLAFWTVFPLALMHYLDHYALRALDVFRPIMDADDREVESWEVSLATMPSGPAALAGLGGAAFLWAVRLANPELIRPIQTSALHFAVGMLVLTLNFALLGALIFHTVRQLHLVTRIYSRATRLDLFRPSSRSPG
jgi:hypothetical protein